MRLEHLVDNMLISSIGNLHGVSLTYRQNYNKINGYESR